MIEVWPRSVIKTKLITVALIIIHLMLSDVSRAQNKPFDKFNKSLDKHFNRYKIDSIDSYTGYIFSILIKTNSKGEIFTLKECSTTDKRFQKNLSYLFANLDKKSLVGLGLENRTFVKPIIVLRSFFPNSAIADSKSYNIWAFENEDLRSAELLQPYTLLYQVTNAPNIDN